MTRFEKGSIVINVNTKEKGVIINILPIRRGKQFYDVHINGQQFTIAENSLIEDINLSDPFEKLKRGIFSTYENFLQDTTTFKIQNSSNSNISTLKSSKTLFRAYQFKPLLKLLNSNNRRLLVADEVGLGKTIEAGHIMLELKARRDLRNALIICPVSLQIKWRDELAEKFNLRFKIYESIKDLIEDFRVQQSVMGIINYEKARKTRNRIIDCLYSEPKEIEDPELEMFPIPTFEIPQFPSSEQLVYPKRPRAAYADTICDNNDPAINTKLGDWIKACDKLNLDYLNNWKEKSLAIFKEYLYNLKDILHENLVQMSKYEIELEKTRIKCQAAPMRFRYFKQASLTSSDIWESEDFSSIEITIWYIAYVLIKIREYLGDDFSVQFGVPCGAANSERDRSVTFAAYKLFISAADLAEQFNSLEEYSRATFEELRAKTEIKILSHEIIDEYYFDDMPEAFAGLVAVTSQQKLGTGFHLLVDIGGGTTDLALFTVDTDLTPNVHSVNSIPIGLNSVFEMHRHKSGKTLESIQKDFVKYSDSPQFEIPTQIYRKELKKGGDSICKAIIQSFIKSYEHHGMKMSKLMEALKFQPLIYCGGGSRFSVLQTTIGNFTDRKNLNKEILDIRNLKNEDSIDDSIFPILSISYGLASFTKGYDQKIECIDLSKVFEAFLPKTDNHSGESYEYGMTDIE